MNRITIRRFDIVRMANIVAAVYVVFALIFGLFIFLPILLIGGIASSQSSSGAAAIFGAGLIGGLIFYVIIVLVYAIFGWIFGAIIAAVYNFVAGRLGGLQLDVTLEGPSGGGYPQPAYPAPYGSPAGYPQGYGQAPTPPWGNQPPPPA
jgi:hypothetical protein